MKAIFYLEYQNTVQNIHDMKFESTGAKWKTSELNSSATTAK